MTSLPETRTGALARWRAFLPGVPAYADSRNRIVAGHGNVSGLGTALRHRLILEDEVIRDTLAEHPFSVAGKWLQEVCWRRYWKGWLEMRPQVWTGWRQRVRRLRKELPPELLAKAEAVADGRSGVAAMDFMARELRETGYLHNHARMWWASFWIHAEGLPWELGADFFFRHLHDADPASNTLSWRWVAGLHTPGKSYLVRLSNLQKYASPEMLEDPGGCARLADGAVTPAPVQDFADTSRHPLPDYPTALPPRRSGRTGLWLHADDLAPETGSLADFKPDAVAAFTSHKTYRDVYQLSPKRILTLEQVLADGLARAAAHYQCPAFPADADDMAGAIAAWARSERLSEVLAYAPFTGPVGDMVPKLTEKLHAGGIRLTFLRRPSDAHAFSLAGAGFFPFWEKMSRHLAGTSAGRQEDYHLFIKARGPFKP